MEGLMGECPDWYATMQAAKYLGVPPWELLDQPVWWRDKAIIAMSAEQNARKILEKRNAQNHK
jgi:hypothetical protein